MIGPVKEFVTGIGYLPRAAVMILRRRRLLLLGAAPAVVTALLLLSGLIALVWFADELVAASTPFADEWADPWRVAFRVAVSVALVIGVALIGVLLFARITLLLGGPFYDRIAEEIDETLGAVSRGHRPWWRQLSSGVVDSIRLILLSVSTALPLFLIGFVPVAGQVIATVIGASVGGWLLTLELVAVPYEIRGLGLADRRRSLRRRRCRVLGFGIPAYLLCLVPLAAIVALPIVVAGATLLARDLVRTE